MNERRSRGLLVAWVAALSLALAPAVQAQGVLVKMATLVPEGSSWQLILKQMAENWRTASGGKVNVRIYAGGVAGDDPDVVRKMRLGTLNASLLTAVGLAEIDKSVYALGVPLMYDSYDELYFVLDKMRPRIEASILGKGFVVLNWADAGWVHFFAQQPVATPDDLKKLKLFTWAGDSDAIDIWKSGGFNPVPLPATELATALQTGLVTALGTPPQVAVISQYYNNANNMTDMQWQLLLGATLIKNDAWQRVPPDIRPLLLQAAEEAGAKLRQDVRASGAEDVAAMKKRGLNVVPVDAKTRELWAKTAEGFYPRIRGPIVPADAFDEALKWRNEYRSKKPGTSAR